MVVTGACMKSKYELLWFWSLAFYSIPMYSEKIKLQLIIVKINYISNLLCQINIVFLQAILIIEY